LSFVDAHKRFDRMFVLRPGFETRG
jgi:hypothetical protein